MPLTEVMKTIEEFSLPRTDELMAHYQKGKVPTHKSKKLITQIPKTMKKKMA